MEATGKSNRRAPARRTLALAMSAALGSCLGLMPAAQVHAAGLIVDNCNDSGNGSLRAAIGSAASGDTIDLTSLMCATISLDSGAIAIAQASLTIEGPGADLSVDGGYADRVFMHTGTGTLSISDLTVSSGKYVNDMLAKGGCIYSAGNLVLDGAVVANCQVVGQDPAVASGGAIFTQGNLTVVSSRITGNTAQGLADANSTSNGGAAMVHGNLIVKYSTFSHNQALPAEGTNSGAGAIETFGSATIVGSTFSHNYAKFFGALAFEGALSDDALILDSTISKNVAIHDSGVYTLVPLSLFNSTIAFNFSSGGGALYSQTASLELQSTILAGNENASGQPNDLDGTFDTPLSGANNLITGSNIPLPGDTIVDCPRLAQLADNGGPTQTHALLDDSPAIDAGNNANNLSEDQRGEPRVFGAAADIGAFEWNGHVEYFFHSSFEPTCDQ